MNRTNCLLAIITLFVSACSSSLDQPQPQASKTLTASPALSSTQTPTQVVSLITPSWTTPIVKKSPSALVTATKISTPIKEITQRPTQPGEAKFTKTAWNQGNSPDMKWFWTVEEEPGMEYFVTHIVNAEGSIEWFIHPEVGKTGWWQATYLPKFWFPKEPYVFMTGHGCCGDGSATHYTERSLVRFNLETGQLSMVLPWKNGSGSYSTGFSPNGKYLFWSAWGEYSIHTVRLSNGNEKIVQLPPKYRDIGGWREDPQKGWSPDGKRVIQEIYLACESGSDDYCYNVSFIIIELETGGYQIIENDLTHTIGVNNQWDYKIAWIDNKNINIAVGTNQQSLKVTMPKTTP